MPRVLGGSYGVGRYFMGEVPLQGPEGVLAGWAFSYGRGTSVVQNEPASGRSIEVGVGVDVGLIQGTKSPPKSGRLFSGLTARGGIVLDWKPRVACMRCSDREKHARKLLELVRAESRHLGPGFRISAFGWRCLGWRVSGAGFRVQSFGRSFQVESLGLRAGNFRVRAESFGCLFKSRRPFWVPM